MISSMFLSLSHGALDIFAAWNRVKDGGECGKENPANFQLYEPERTIKLQKTKITNIREIF